MQIFFTEKAKKHLIAIEEYFNTVAPYKTVEILSDILNLTDQLESAPLSGPEDPFLKECGLTRRFLVEGNYKIIYRVDREIIYITQIFDARQEPQKLVEEEK